MFALACVCCLVWLLFWFVTCYFGTYYFVAALETWICYVGAVISAVMSTVCMSCDICSMDQPNQQYKILS
jgi:fucose 4-O-acetylase-like acetyltransferase